MTKTAHMGFVMGLPLVVSALGGENMIGRQTQNEGLFAVPAPGAVTIDGRLDEWDLSGQIWSFADIGIRDRFSVRTAAMWDAKHLYLCFLWKDPTPLNSMVNPDFDPDKGWVADAVQLRVLAGGQTSWFTTWYYSKAKMPVLHAAYWKDESDPKKGLDIEIYKGKDGATDLGGGIEMAYQPLADGSGFIQEAKIPWRILYRKDHTAAAGDTIRMGMEFLWGDATGKTWPIHRYADNMQPGQTSREFFWTARKAWGDLTLLGQGGIATRRYVSAESKLAGSIPVRATLPGKASGFTLVVEDAAGRRVRNLAGSFDPSEYAVPGAPEGTVEVLWDGLDDAGEPVKPGVYRVRGLTHGPLGAEYELCFFNPGTPPWEVPDSSGSWGADHTPPRLVTRAGDSMIIGWTFAEGGHGMLRVNAKGRKVWGEKRGALALAADESYVYARPNRHHTEDAILRISVADGAYRPFVLDGKERPFELPVSAIVGGEAPGAVLALAVAGNELIVVFDTGRIAVLDKTSAALKRLLDTGLKAVLPTPAGMDARVVEGQTAGIAAVSTDGRTLFLNSGGVVHAVDLDKGGASKVELPGVALPGAMAVDNDGHLLVMDNGPDQQIKALRRDGTLAYTRGRRGGRPIRGAFDEQALIRVSSIAVDAAGNVWAVESWDYPRRVSVWGADGKLLRDYIGNTGYAGTGCFLHDNDPSRAYVGPVEIRLDRETGAWRVSSVVWVPDTGQGEHFTISIASHAHAQVFYSEASGARREYMFVPPYRGDHGFLILMNGGNGWRPVSYIGSVGVLSGEFGRKGVLEGTPQGEFAGHDLRDGVFWNDFNGDGRVQYAECEIVRVNTPSAARRPASHPLPLGNGWGARMDATDLSFYAADAAGMARYRPERFQRDGAPVYTHASLRRYDNGASGELVPVPGGNTVLAMDGGGARGGYVRGIDRETGEELWRYPNPYPGVHGSHRATMPKAGLLIGPLKIMGTVDMGDPIGGVFALRGNLGQDFYMTTDGLFIAAMFQDGRLPRLSLPLKEEALKGMPLELFSMGGEPFNGWLGRQADGVIRMSCGLPRQAAMSTRITGLDSIRRFTASDIEVTEAMLAQALRDNAARAAKPGAEAAYTIARWKTDGGWERVEAARVAREGHPSSASVKLAWDDDYLYARFEVMDPSPWRNQGKDVTRLFKTGDAVDIQLSASGHGRRQPAEGDQRIVIAPFQGRPVAVLMRPVDSSAQPAGRVHYHSPVMDVVFARVRTIEGSALNVTTGDGRYTVEARLPWRELGLTPRSGLAVRGDLGFILSDEAGTLNTARIYWANKDTNLINDLPGEAQLTPDRWGSFRFE